MSATTERGTRVVDVAPELVELTNHLFDGDQLFLPFLKLGHYATDNPAAHGYVAFTLDVDGNLPVAKHPPDRQLVDSGRGRRSPPLV